jgi:hypothetical protein
MIDVSGRNSMKKLYFFITMLFFASSVFALTNIPYVVPSKTLKLNFDFFVKYKDAAYSKEYTGNALVDNKEEVIFSYNNRISKDDKGIKVSIKPIITMKGTHFLVKYFKKDDGKFYLYSKSVVKHKIGKKSKIQIIDGDNIYKLLIKSNNRR